MTSLMTETATFYKAWRATATVTMSHLPIHCQQHCQQQQQQPHHSSTIPSICSYVDNCIIFRARLLKDYPMQFSRRYQQSMQIHPLLSLTNTKMTGQLFQIIGWCCWLYCTVWWCWVAFSAMHRWLSLYSHNHPLAFATLCWSPFV